MPEEIIKELKEIDLLIKEQGKTKMAKKRFWKVVGKVKRMNPAEISDEVTNLASNLREQLYPRKIILSSTKGLTFALVGFIFTFILLIWVILSLNLDFTVMALILLVVIFTNLYFSFLLGRCLGSAISGIKIDGFYRYSPMEFGVRMNYNAYLKAPQSKRAVLFGTTLMFESVVLLAEVILFAMLSEIKYTVVPLGILFVWLIGSYGIHKKVRTGELHRFLRELKILKEIKRKQ